jgi:sulfite exporter TauE/SafE
MIPFLVAAFTFGILGNFHCIAMCGPIAASVMQNTTQKRNVFIGSLFYNLGRVYTYTLLGLIIGLAGQQLVLFGFQKLLSVVSGITLILFILYPTLSTKLSAVLFVGKLKKFFGNFILRKSNASKFILGTLNGLLPCGLVYMAIATSIAIGNPFYSALFMFVFGLSTIPGLFGIGISKSFLNIKTKSFFKKLSPTFSFLVAALLILRGLNLGIPYLNPTLVKQENNKPAQIICHKPIKN